MMTIYESVKASVTPRMATERYGLKFHPNGMACCPFHPDRHPSMKLNPDYYYCFGCGSSGDVVDLTARLLGISALEAAQKLADDFALSDRPVPAESNQQRDLIDRERLCHRALSDYLHILQRWKEKSGILPPHRTMCRIPGLQRPAICWSMFGIRQICWPPVRGRSVRSWWPI